MTKQLFLSELHKKTKDPDLVCFIDEIISDKVEAGENEALVIAKLCLDETFNALEKENLGLKEKTKAAFIKVQSWFKEKFKKKEQLDNEPRPTNPIKKALRWCKETRIVSSTIKFVFKLAFAIAGIGLMLAGILGLAFGVYIAIDLAIASSGVAFILLAFGIVATAAGGIGISGWAVFNRIVKGKKEKLEEVKNNESTKNL